MTQIKQNTNWKIALWKAVRVGVAKAIEIAILIFALGITTKYLLVAAPAAATASVIANMLIKKI